jgi:serine/threonine protein kinase
MSLADTLQKHLVRPVDEKFEPWPCLILEYVPLGTLRDQCLNGNVPEDEILTILEQSLSALAYLHGLKPPIAHRDIKPDNILVQSLEPLYIKLADFGLAKAECQLETICGTSTYAAPEIAKYIGSSRSVPREKYTTAIEIWSLGVVILWCGYGLPDAGEGGGVLWCTQIIRRAKSRKSDDVIDLLTTPMLVRASNRQSAKTCWNRVLDFVHAIPRR